MYRIRQELQRLLRDEQGLSAIEYGILASLIALAALQALGGLGNETRTNFDQTGNKLAEQNAKQISDGNASQNNPDEPPVAADTAPDSNTTNPDEPPIAAMAPVQ